MNYFLFYIRILFEAVVDVRMKILILFKISNFLTINYIFYSNDIKIIWIYILPPLLLSFWYRIAIAWRIKNWTVVWCAFWWCTCYYNISHVKMFEILILLKIFFMKSSEIFSDDGWISRRQDLLWTMERDWSKIKTISCWMIVFIKWTLWWFLSFSQQDLLRAKTVEIQNVANHNK